ncbi:hypothetical protein Tco_1428159 [Tanacetum coccineum]
MVGRPLDRQLDPFRAKEHDEDILGHEIPYLSAIGALMYLASNTRPNIAFSVNLLARYSSEPTRRHWNGMKHIFCYLCGTRDMRLFYQKNSKSKLVRYADAGYLSDPHKARSHQAVNRLPRCIAAVDYVSGIHVASSGYWLASFFARLFKMTNFAVKHSIMTQEMVENFCNDYYIPDEVHPVAPGRDKTITQFPEVQKKDDQVKLPESTSHCFMSLVTPAASGSSSAAAPEVSAPAEVEPENVVPEDTYLDLTEPDEVVATQSGKSKRKRLGKQSDTLSAKQLRKDHPSLATGTGGKTLDGLRQLMPTSPLVLRPSVQADIQAHVVVQSARIADVPVYTAAATVTSTRENVDVTPTSDVAGSSQLETSEGSDDSFYELPALNCAKVKRCMDYEQLYTEFNVGAARQIYLESEVRSRVEHELELKEKLKGKYDARGRLLEEKDLEILILKSLLAEEAEKAERAETAEVVRLRGQVSALTGEVSALKSTIAQKDTDISLLDSRATYLKSALDDSKAACDVKPYFMILSNLLVIDFNVNFNI